MNKTLGYRSSRPFNNLDLIRYFLAACVCFTHSFNLLYGDNTDPLGLATGGAVGLGGLAVDLFFVISGFLIFKSWENSRGVKDFLIKRVLRIYPAFLVVTLFCGLVFGPLGSPDPAAYFSNFKTWLFVRQALQLGIPAVPDTLPGVAFPNLLNGSLWTIKYEFLCYLLLGLAGFLKILRFRWLLLSFFLVSLAIFSFSSCIHFIATWFPSLGDLKLPGVIGDVNIWPRFLTYFLAGATFYAYRNRIIQNRLLFVVAWVMVLGGIFYLRMPNLVIPIFGPYLVYYMAFSDALKFHGFGKHGDFSYGVYLYAFPLQQLLAFHLGAHLNGLTMFVTSLAMATLFAVFSWHVIEKPALSLKKKLRPTRSSGT